MATTRIELTQLNHDTFELLKELVQQMTNTGMNFLAKDTELTLAESRTIITLSHDIIQRRRNRHPAEVRYEIVDHQHLIGSGGFSKVYGILATLAWQDEELLIKTHKQRVVKIQECSSAELKEIQKEVDITQKAKTMHMKQPVVVQTDDNSYQCYMVMHRLSGSDLYSILTQMYKAVLDLSTYQRLTIAMKLLQQLKVLHDNGVLHRDIKPDNVMLDLNTGELTIFDFGLSRTEEMPDPNDFRGTPGYIPPEVFNYSGTSKKSDVFSMSLVIGLLFNADEPAQSIDRFPPYGFENIFKDKQLDLTENEKVTIFKTLKNMSKMEREERVSVDQALTTFTTIRDDYVNRKIDEMVKHKTPQYLFANGLFVNNVIAKPKTVLLRRHSCGG